MIRVPRVAALTAAAFLSSIALSAAGQFGQSAATTAPQAAPPQSTPPSARVPGQARPSTPPPSSGQQGRREESRLQPQGFSVVLVLADLTTTTAQDDVPPAARRALADMKDFLPYKSYKLLDAAWLLGQGSTGGVTRLRGPEEQEYELRLSAYPVPSSNGRVQVQFSLRDGGVVEHVDAPSSRDNERRIATESEMRAREAELERLQRELGDAKKRNDATQVRSLERRIASVRDAIALTRSVQNRKSMPSRAIMDTSFAMDVGETVVVGTSRLRGNTRALIALLTAVPPRAGKTDTTRY
jgi:hypothetical protein